MSEFETGGMYLMPKGNSRELEGIFFVRSGLFKNGVFRFNLSLDSNFPHQETAPIIQLTSAVPHPLIHPESLIFDSSAAFPTWKTEDHIYELLKYFRYSFENFEYSCDSVNPPNVKETVTKSINDVFASNDESNKNQYVFTYDKIIVDQEHLHDQILENMKNFSDSSLENFNFSFERRG
jgi:ubiquitin-protein ligase